MEATKEKVTNVERQAFVHLESSVRVESGSIMPERFGSTSSPVGTSLVTPELGSVSVPQPVAQKSAGFR